jgi:hypothetical protein
MPPEAENAILIFGIDVPLACYCQQLSVIGKPENLSTDYVDFRRLSPYPAALGGGKPRIEKS